jgi:hypothetical protein
VAEIVDLGTEDATLDADGKWRYVEGDDMVEYYNDGGAGVSGADPNTMIMEAGDDWASITERIRRKASRLVESRLDYRMSREVVKDREGNYPAIIVHATALQAVILLLKSHDPTNEIIEPFQDEYAEIVDGLSAGSIVLPTAISGDSSKGVIREVKSELASTVTSLITPFDESPDIAVGNTIEPADNPSTISAYSSWNGSIISFVGSCDFNKSITACNAVAWTIIAG